MKRFTIVVSIFLLVSFNAFADPERQEKIEQFKSDFSQYNTLSLAGRWDEALPWAEKVYHSAKSLFSEKSKNLAVATHNYGYALLQLRREKEARGILDEALDLHRSIFGKDAMELVPIYMDLGVANAHKRNKIKEKSKANFDRALRVVAKHNGKDSVEWARHAVEAGSNLLHKSKSPSGKKMLEKAHVILSKELGDKSKEAGYAAFLIGKYNLSLKKNRTAVKYLDKALASFDSPDKPSSVMELSTHAFLVEAFENQGMQEEATQHCMAIGRMTPFTSTQDYKPIYKPLPRFPKGALKRNEEGWVTVAYDVDEFGFTINHTVEDSEGSDSFVEPAIEVAKKYRYAPAFVDGEPVVTKGVRTRTFFNIAK